MKLFYSFILSLILLLSCLASANADTYVCEEQGFTFDYDPAYSVEWQDENGAVIYTDEAGYIPYALVWCGKQGNTESVNVDKLLTGYSQSMRSDYGDRLSSVEEGLSLTVGGEVIPGARYIYDVNGYDVELMVFFHKTGDSVRQYTAKYISGSDEAQATVEAMARAINSFKLTNAQADNTPASEEEDVLGFEILPITWDGVNIGKLALPTGYVQMSEMHCCDESTCMGAPLKVSLTVMPEDYGMISMSYNTNESYIDRVSTDYGFLKAGEGQLDSQTAAFQRHYLNAAQYCDERAAAMNASYWKDEPTAFFEKMVYRHYNEFYNSAVSLLPSYMQMEGCEVTAAERVYTYEAGGRTWAMCIAAEVRGLQYRIAGTNEVCAVWELPGGYFQLICPVEDFDRLHDGAFAAFMQNTSMTDKFYEIQESISNQIRDQVISQMNMVIAQSVAYAAAMDSFMSESVNSYLSSSSYDSATHFSDYIFDQNTYTTSNGCDISISTAYDYVWEGSNGNVYYSQYASDMPYGATQLSPH